MKGMGNLARRGAVRFAGQRRRTFDLNVERAVAVGRSRLRVTALIFAAAFLGVAARLVDVALSGDRVVTGTNASKLQDSRIERRDIVDRNGVLLATNLTTASLHVDPRKVLDVEESLDKIIAVLPDLDREVLRRKVTGSHHFAWIKRNLTPREQNAIHNLGLPGFAFEREQRRVYPLARLFAHVVGFAGIDNYGLAGIERSIDDRLRIPAVRPARPLEMTLDTRFQHLVREELLRGVRQFQAIAAVGIVLDVESGEVRAMVSLPDFDPNNIGSDDKNARFNRATQGVYEMGSTFKLFTAAMALDSGTVSLEDGYDASEPLQVGRYTIRDFHGKGRWLSVPEIVMYSSNIGAAKMARDVGTARQQEFLARLGLLERVPIELDEVEHPLLPTTWYGLNTMTIAYGHGLAVTPLQLASAVAALVNGGVLRPPTLFRRPDGSAPPGVRVISLETSADLRKLMRLVVVHGTGRKAESMGYLVGGKTGTAEKVESGGYREDASISSFVGAFPMDGPRFVVMVIFDEALSADAVRQHVGGGWTAAPVVGKIISRLGPLAGIAPKLELEPVAAREARVSPPPPGIPRKRPARAAAASEPGSEPLQELLSKVLGRMR